MKINEKAFKSAVQPSAHDSAFSLTSGSSFAPPPLQFKSERSNVDPAGDTMQLRGISEDEMVQTKAGIKRTKTHRQNQQNKANKQKGEPLTNSTFQRKEVSEEDMEEAHFVAEDMIEDIGGSEKIDEIFGSGFSDRYYDLMLTMESGELDFSSFIGSLPEQDQIALQDHHFVANNQYGELFEILFEETGKAVEDIDHDKVDEALLLLDKLEVRTELMFAMSNYYELLKEQGFLEFMPAIIALCKAFAALKYQSKLNELEEKLKAIQTAVDNAESDLKKAASETAIDLGLGAVAVGLTAIGAMTPGVNVAIFIGGIAVGYALSTEDTSTKMLQTGAKGGGFTVSKALEHSKKFGGHVKKIKSIVPGLDLILNSKESFDKYQQLAILQALLKEFEKYYDQECKTLMKDLEAQFKKLEGVMATAETAYENNWDTLDNYENQIRKLQATLDAFE